MTEKNEPAYLSGEWIRTRTDDQLRQQVDGNMPGGRAHDASLAELNRREADRAHRSEMRWIKATFWASVILGLLAIAASAVSLFRDPGVPAPSSPGTLPNAAPATPAPPAPRP